MSPFGEMAWHDVPQLSDDEMKELMINIVDHWWNATSWS
jgi:hypothetical protein